MKFCITGLHTNDLYSNPLHGEEVNTCQFFNKCLCTCVHAHSLHGMKKIYFNFYMKKLACILAIIYILISEYDYI